MLKRDLVIIGNGMVSHRFAEKLIEYGGEKRYNISIFGEEARRAYDRVHLSEYFQKDKQDSIYLSESDWYKRNGIELYLSHPILSIQPIKRTIVSSNIEKFFHECIIATGSKPFIPPIEGVNIEGVYSYRTLDDMEEIKKSAKKTRVGAVIGGGLLGLEAAKVLKDLGKEVHVFETADRLMPRQLDEQASSILLEQIEKIGIKIHLNSKIKKIIGNERVEKLEFENGEIIPAGIVILSSGIRPRDELAKASGINTGANGGIIVDDFLHTNYYGIYAIGEVALHKNQQYGLVAPGYDMADVLAFNLCGFGSRLKKFTGFEQSTKLKLAGLEAASFGDIVGDNKQTPIIFNNPRKGVYKRINISSDGKTLLGGILIGDTKSYGNLLNHYLNKIEVPEEPETLIVGSVSVENIADSDLLPDEAKICACNNISKGQILSAIKDSNCMDVTSLKAVTKAGTGCGGCLQQINSILIRELKKQGKVVSNHLCEHFKYSRQELFQLVKLKGLKTYQSILTELGQGYGCEVCKPAVASILASIYNEPILKHREIQDTNDKYLANIQKNGSYSVVPRIPGGEILPSKLSVIAEVAEKYGLYCKLTGGQRIDLFGARLEDLPKIWKDLIAEGFESGHAYGKALRTVKSCVGSTWCRFGVQDSTSFAIRLENRYKGLRAPHKVKSAVSGCIRECAEARSKDFGVIATEKGWNLYFGGNGGVNPKHAVLFAEDIDEETCLKYIDRLLMFYVRTADKLMRTSTWLEQLDGGINYLKDVIINDRLGINKQLEEEMKNIIGTYACEWKSVVDEPEKQKLFQAFINTSEKDSTIQFEMERGQIKPFGKGRETQLR